MSISLSITEPDNPIEIAYLHHDQSQADEASFRTPREVISTEDLPLMPPWLMQYLPVFRGQKHTEGVGGWDDESHPAPICKRARITVQYSTTPHNGLTWWSTAACGCHAQTRMISVVQLVQIVLSFLFSYACIHQRNKQLYRMVRCPKQQRLLVSHRPD